MSGLSSELEQKLDDQHTNVHLNFIITVMTHGSHIVCFAICIYMSRPMGKPTICIGEKKGADQLRGNREADQHLSFRYSDSTIPPLLNSKISSF